MKKIFISALVALCGFTASYAQQASFLSNNHCLYRISQESQNQKCLLLPVQENAEIANIKVIADNKQVKAFNVKLAKDHVDYYVPLYMALDLQIIQKFYISVDYLLIVYLEEILESRS